MPNHKVEEPFCISEEFAYRKFLGLTGEYHEFLSIFLPIVLEKFVGEPLCALFEKISGSKKFYGQEEGGGEVSKIVVEIFFS